MRIDGSNGIGAGQAGSIGQNDNTQTDAYTKDLQRQIALDQQKLQEISSNGDLSMEDKMKKRQEIQKEIALLQQQLRQHQIEVRREQQQQGSSIDDMVAKRQDDPNTETAGLSQNSMKAMISADNSVKQSDAQKSVATSLKGKKDVLIQEAKMDAARGGSTEKKEAAIESLSQKEQQAATMQQKTLSEAVDSMQKAAKEEQTGVSKADDPNDANDPDKLKEQDKQSNEAMQSIQPRVDLYL